MPPHVHSSYRLPSFSSAFSFPTTEPSSSSSAAEPRQPPPFGTPPRHESIQQGTPGSRPHSSSGATPHDSASMDPPPRRLSMSGFPSVFELPKPTTPSRTTFATEGQTSPRARGLGISGQSSGSAEGRGDKEVPASESASTTQQPTLYRPVVSRKRKSEVGDAPTAAAPRRGSAVSATAPGPPPCAVTTGAPAFAPAHPFIKRESSESPGVEDRFPQQASPRPSAVATSVSPRTASSTAPSLTSDDAPAPASKRPRLSLGGREGDTDPLDSLASAATSLLTASNERRQREAELAQTEVIRQRELKEIERRRVASGEVALGLGGGLGAALQKLSSKAPEKQSRKKAEDKTTDASSTSKGRKPSNAPANTTGMSLGKRRGADAREKTKNLTIVTTAPSAASIDTSRSAPPKVMTPSVLLPPTSAPVHGGGHSPYFPSQPPPLTSRASYSGPAGRRGSGSTTASGYKPPHQLPTPLQSSYSHSGPRYVTTPGGHSMVQSLSGGGGPPYFHASHGQAATSANRSPPTYVFPAPASPHMRERGPPSAALPTSASTTSSSYSLHHLRDQHQSALAASGAAAAMQHSPPSTSSGPNSATSSNSKSAFLSLFSTFYDSLSDSRILTRTLEDQLRKSSTLLAGLQDATSARHNMVDSIVEQRLSHVVKDTSSELQLLEERIVRLERVVGGACEEPIADALSRRRERLQRRSSRVSSGPQSWFEGEDEDDGEGEGESAGASAGAGSGGNRQAVLARLDKLERMLLEQQSEKRDAAVQSSSSVGVTVSA